MEAENKEDKPIKKKAISKKKQPPMQEYDLKVRMKYKGEFVNKMKLTKEGADFFRSKNWI